jgi:putative membrane protein
MSKGTQSPYARFADDDLTLRDLLAVDRTVVANERTLLGFIRTSLALLLTGASLIKFSDSEILNTAGWAVGGISIPLFLSGAIHFRRRRAGLLPLMNKVPL